MHCAARETARFLAERGATPPQALRRFMGARCGAPQPRFAFASVRLDVGKDRTDDEVTAKLRVGAEKMIADTVGAGARLAGIAMVRSDKRAVLVVTAQERGVSLERLPTAAAAGKVVLRGELLNPAASVRALVNRGRFSYAVCKANEGVKLPSFEIVCDAAPEDASAWVTVAAFPAGRILGNDVLDVLVFPNGKPTSAFAAPRPSAGAKPGRPAEADVVAELNALRKEAGLAAVALDARESAVVAKLTPHYFAAASGLEDETIADKVVLGVRAGWDVQGVVLSADTTSVVVRGASDAQSLLQEAIESPFGRSALFDPEIRRVAVGLLYDEESKSSAALFGAYALADTQKHEKDAARLVERITRLRAARKLPPPLVLAQLSPDAIRAARSLESGDKTLDEALDELVHRSVGAMSTAMQGFYATGPSIESIKIAEEILSRPSLSIALAVGHHRAPGKAWASLVALIVIDADKTAAHTARLAVPAAL